MIRRFGPEHKCLYVVQDHDWGSQVEDIWVVQLLHVKSQFDGNLLLLRVNFLQIDESKHVKLVGLVVPFNKDLSIFLLGV